MKRLNMTGILTAGIAALLFATAPAGAADEQGSIQGVVNDATGRPVAGAFVKLKNDARRLTYMVVTQGQGQFEAKDLPPGQYRVQAVGGGQQSEWFTNVGVTAGGAAKVGLSLSTSAARCCRRPGRSESRRRRRIPLRWSFRTATAKNWSRRNAPAATICSGP